MREVEMYIHSLIFSTLGGTGIFVQLYLVWRILSISKEVKNEFSI